MPRNVLIQVRRDTAANWTSTDPTLASGELGWESDTNKLKFGDGSTAWNSLPYFASALTGWGEAATATFSGSGSPVGVTTPNGEGDLYIDTTTPAVWQATGATSADWREIGAGSGNDVPIGDTTGYTNTIAYTDPVSGNPVTVVTLPADTSVIAVGLAGDAFPRLVIRADPTGGGGIGLSLSDGTIDPYGGAAYGSTGSSGEIPLIQNEITGTQVIVGFSDGNGNAVVAANDGLRTNNNGTMFSGAGDPNGAYGGNVGDRFFRTDYTGAPLTNDYICTTAGAADTAVWTGYA